NGSYRRGTKVLSAIYITSSGLAQGNFHFIGDAYHLLMKISHILVASTRDDQGAGRVAVFPYRESIFRIANADSLVEQSGEKSSMAGSIPWSNVGKGVGISLIGFKHRFGI